MLSSHIFKLYVVVNKEICSVVKKIKISEQKVSFGEFPQLRNHQKLEGLIGCLMRHNFTSSNGVMWVPDVQKYAVA